MTNTVVLLSNYRSPNEKEKFYHENVLQPAEFWNRIWWTDKSMILMNFFNSRVFVCRKAEKALSYKCASTSLKSLVENEWDLLGFRIAAPNNMNEKNYEKISLLRNGGYTYSVSVWIV